MAVETLDVSNSSVVTIIEHAGKTNETINEINQVLSSIPSTYSPIEGSTSLTTTGTITTGTWNADIFLLEYGGTSANNASDVITNLGLGSLATANTVNDNDWSGTVLGLSNGGTEGSSKQEAAKTFESWHVLAAGAPGTTHTGSTVGYTNMLEVVVPGGIIGNIGVVRITSLWSATNNANVKSLSIQYGDSHKILDVSAGDISNYHDCRYVFHRTSEFTYNPRELLGGWGRINDQTQVSTLDTSTDFSIYFQGSLDVATDVITLESYLVEVFYQA